MVTLEMGKVFEMSDTNSIFTHLIACEHFIAYSCRGQIPLYRYVKTCRFFTNSWCVLKTDVCCCLILCCSLEQEASKCAASGNTERHRELTEKLKQQHDILEAERKVCQY
jgi:hypothetical protein